MLVHVIPVGIGVIRGQADVFIEIKRAALRKIKFLVAMHPRKVCVDGFHRPAGGETEDRIRTDMKFLFNDSSDQLHGGFGAGADNAFHGLKMDF